MNTPTKIVAFSAFVGVVLALLAIVDYLFMLLWNAPIPPLFHGPRLNFWEALGIMVLAGFITSGLRNGWKS